MRFLLLWVTAIAQLASLDLGEQSSVKVGGVVQFLVHSLLEQAEFFTKEL